MTRRPVLVAAVCALQLGLVGVGVAAPLSARLTGEQVRLRVAPVDPVDPFRGAYVALDYPDLPLSPVAADGSSRGTVFVPLRRSGEVWTGGAATPERPSAAPYLACESDGWTVRCGIESWFVPQERASALQDALVRREAVATVRVDGRGHAALVGLTVS
ncbi:MAG TPA: GDYXXLXY domain-containing protein [Dermatophilaceae bacterium]|nr:GDYXXLXY domain-containing protein [Dermatophilaceae bacterium]